MQGALYLGSRADRVIPILPDPYASNVTPDGEASEQRLIAATAWKEPSAPQVGFEFSQPSIANVDMAPVGHASRLAFALRDGIFERLDALYDVSSSQNQFGVVVDHQALVQGKIVDQQLSVSGQNGALFSVPGIAWEPVLDPGRNSSGISQDDGPPEILGVLTTALRPLSPARSTTLC